MVIVRSGLWRKSIEFHRSTVLNRGVERKLAGVSFAYLAQPPAMAFCFVVMIGVTVLPS